MRLFSGSNSSNSAPPRAIIIRSLNPSRFRDGEEDDAGDRDWGERQEASSGAHPIDRCRFFVFVVAFERLEVTQTLEFFRRQTKRDREMADDEEEAEREGAPRAEPDEGGEREGDDAETTRRESSEKADTRRRR